LVEVFVAPRYLRGWEIRGHYYGRSEFVARGGRSAIFLLAEGSEDERGEERGEINSLMKSETRGGSIAAGKRQPECSVNAIGVSIARLRDADQARPAKCFSLRSEPLSR
jgi:hypothetical protein